MNSCMAACAAVIVKSSCCVLQVCCHAVVLKCVAPHTSLQMCVLEG